MAFQIKKTTPGPLNNSITKMLSQVKQSEGFSRPNLYRVEIHPPDPGPSMGSIRSIQLNCDSVAIPGAILATKENKTFGLQKHYVYDKLLEMITLTFYVSDNMQEFHFFQEWFELMYDKGRHCGYYKEYVGTVEIHQLSRNRDDKEDLGWTMKAILLDAFPKTITPLSLGHSLNDSIQKLSVNFVYKKVEFRYQDLPSSNAKNSTLPISKTIDNKTMRMA
tara:strand:- start:981 stop:1640 length:660 start_codon:yes stop_codon:yes gene_type:complete